MGGVSAAELAGFVAFGLAAPFVLPVALAKLRKWRERRARDRFVRDVNKRILVDREGVAYLPTRQVILRARKQ